MSETPTANPTRELAAIMFSDIAGYTLIMGRDEARAMHALGEHRALLRTCFRGSTAGCLASLRMALEEQEGSDKKAWASCALWRRPDASGLRK